jgi:hypothetical protein
MVRSDPNEWRSYRHSSRAFPWFAGRRRPRARVRQVASLGRRLRYGWWWVRASWLDPKSLSRGTSRNLCRLSKSGGWRENPTPGPSRGPLVFETSVLRQRAHPTQMIIPGVEPSSAGLQPAASPRRPDDRKERKRRDSNPHTPTRDAHPDSGRGPYHFSPRFR